MNYMYISIIVKYNYICKYIIRIKVYVLYAVAIRYYIRYNSYSGLHIIIILLIIYKYDISNIFYYHIGNILNMLLYHT